MLTWCLIVLILTFHPAALDESTTQNIDGPNNRTNVLIDLEIISLNVIPIMGNSVEVIWGKKLGEYHADWNYLVYYGQSIEQASQAPRSSMKDMRMVVDNLEFCTKYYFAVSMTAGNLTSTPPSARSYRSIVTGLDPYAPPTDLSADYLPEDGPQIIVRWSASCPNIIQPIGYIITIHEKDTARMLMLRKAPTIDDHIVHVQRVVYGSTFDIKVSTDNVKKMNVTTISFRVPLFLQPYKVRLTKRHDGTCILYWKEPYVPYYVGPYIYEVYVYGANTTAKYEAYRPIFVYRRDNSTDDYRFLVGLVSADRAHRSHLAEVDELSTQSFTA